MKERYFILDFDSTFVKVEALDMLAEISLAGDKSMDAKLTRVKALTEQAMNGSLAFGRSLKHRITLLNANKEHIAHLVKKLEREVSQSVKGNRNFFRKYAENIIIVSGGFKEYIVPVVAKYGIVEENVYANTFRFDKKGNITGYDSSNCLCRQNGKVKQLAELKQQGRLTGEVIAIGDGHTDYELKKSGLVDKFYVFTENIRRGSVVKNADHIVPSFDEFLYVSKLPMSVSYPKSRIKVLLLENIHKDAVQMFSSEGYSVETCAKSLGEDELAARIKDVSILGIRSKTNVTAAVLQKANKLHAIGAFCVGVNQIDLKTCSEKGVIVFNAPFSNTRSVVELALGEIIMLMRGIFTKSEKLHKGVWEKSSVHSNEVRGKKLGIIGYGKIGSQLSVLAEDMGMKVYYYDIVEKLALGNAKRCKSLKELLKKSDIITVHVDGRKENHNLISDKEFTLMNEGVVFVNLSRGFVVDIGALRRHLKSGRVKGAAIDVFPHEPHGNNEKFSSPLQNLENVILTPHIGGSTDEAQRDIAGFVPGKLIDFINSGNSYSSVNFPNIQLPPFENAHRLIHIHRNVPGILADINSVFAEHKINIMGQYLNTNESIGYVITDISKKYNPALIKELREIPYTIKFRVLY